jgi:1,5-anhydro-D-fructose reductase (1,5-anhydro-D-mannitol-forming)
MLRTAMLSFAHVHANGYADQLVRHQEAEITRIWDDDPDRGKTASERYNVPWSDDIDAVLSSPDVDAAVVNAPTNQHPEVYKAALRHGKHLFTEKALTVSTKDADEIVRLVHESGVKFMISLPSRTRPEILFMKQVLDKGLLGRITLMRARIAHSAALDKWFSGGSAWFADEVAAGGGALFDLGCHTTDVMRWFMGKPSKVMAKVNNFLNAYPIDDNSAAVIEFQSGALGMLDCGWVHRAGPNPYELYGTEGYLGMNTWPGGGIYLTSTKLEADGIRGTITSPQLPPPLPGPMDQWISAILHGTEMTITVEDGRNLTEMLEAIYVSSREGREVKVV